MSKKVMGDSSKKRKVTTSQALTLADKNFSFQETASKEAQVMFNTYFKNREVALERGIDLATASANIKALIKHYHWEKLVKIRDTDINFTIVAEFYAVLSQIPNLADVQSIDLRKVKVSFTPEAINTFLGIPEVPHDEIYSVKWELDEKNNQFNRSREAQEFINPCATWREGRFKIGGASDDAKVIKHLTAYNIVPHSHTPDINCDEACMIYAILTKQPIDVGKIIHKVAYEFARALKEKGVMPYPGLIYDLCIHAHVQTLPSDRMIPPATLTISSKVSRIREQESQVSPNITLGEPSFGQPIPPSQGSYSQDPALVTRLDNMETSMREMMSNMRKEMRKGIQTLHDNIFRGLEMNRQWCDDIRLAVRGQRDLTMAIYNHHPINMEDFDTCQVEPYAMPTWNPLFPTPTPTHTSTQAFGGGTGTTFAGMARGDVPISGITSGLDGNSLQGSTVMTTQLGELGTIPYEALGNSYDSSAGSSDTDSSAD